MLATNGRAFCCAGILCSVSQQPKPIEKTEVEVMQKADSNCSARTGADSEQKDQDIFVSQHSRKPLCWALSFKI
jgi:hypothetical protein